MPNGIGETLRKARNRRKLPLFEVEAETKIRARYLHAIEAEEWDALPEGSYARSFIRTYANFLGLDGDRLAAEFGQAPPASTDRGPARAAPRPSPRGGPAAGGRRRPRLLVPAVVVAVIAVAAAAISLIGGSGGSSSPAPGAGEVGSAKRGAASPPESRPKPSQPALTLLTTAEVWVCVLDSDGKALVDGKVMPSGAEAGPFHSGSFTVAFGNGEVEMSIDGKQIQTPESANPLGYEIGRGGGLTELDEGERPTCT